MAVNGVTDTTQSYDAYQTTSAKAEQTQQSTNTSAQEEPKTVVYEKSSDITKMSASDRANLVKQLKADEEARKTQFTNLVMNMIQKQGDTFAKTIEKDEDGIWKFLAKGDFEVDAQTKAEAQEAISEDGYWGVKQTSERIFDFALALSGGDKDKMTDMLAAFEKGFNEATKAWGQELPDISQQTYDAVQKLFENYNNEDIGK